MVKDKHKEISEVQCQYYTPREVATVLNLSTDLVYGLLRDGKMPAVKIGSGKRMIWRIPKTGFEDYLNQHSVEKKATPSTFEDVVKEMNRLLNKPAQRGVGVKHINLPEAKKPMKKAIESKKTPKADSIPEPAEPNEKKP